MIRVNGQSKHAEFFDVAPDVDGWPVTFVTGRGGEFYVEDLQAGRYKAELFANGTRCRFELDIPDAKVPLTDLGQLVCPLSGEPDRATTSRPR